MKKLFRKSISLVATLVLILSMSNVAFAQGTTSISVTKSSVDVGGKTTVSVTASESGTVTVKYTASLLNLNSCSASGYSAEGNSVTFSGKSGDLEFIAAAEGTASIIVSSSACSGSSTTITVGGSSASDSAATETKETTDTSTETTEETATEETTEETDTTAEETEAASETTAAPSASAVGTLNSDGGFDIDGVSYVVSERYSSSEIPSGFSKKTITIGSSTYNELSNGTITLVYLKPADNTSGSGTFYIYDEAASSVSSFLYLGSSDNYVIISTADATLSSAMTETSLEVTGGTAVAYTVDGSEFFYIYGTNQDGYTGWFVYDKTYDTLSRVDTSSIGTSSTEDTSSDTSYDVTETYTKKLDLFRKIISALVVLCVVLLFVIINMFFRRSNEDDSEDDIFATKSEKKSIRFPRSIVFRKDDDDDIFSKRGNDYADDEDEEYDEDEEELDEDELDVDEEYDDEYYDEDDEEYEESTPSYSSSNSASLNMMDLNDL